MMVDQAMKSELGRIDSLRVQRDELKRKKRYSHMELSLRRRDHCPMQTGRIRMNHHPLKNHGEIYHHSES